VPEAGARRLDADIAIAGLGGIGSAAALFAARRGQRVLGLERFELGGHHRGASHDHSRIIRRSYHTEHYVRLTSGAYDAWREVEALGGEQCVWVTGGLDLFPPGAAIDATTYISSMDAAGVPFDVVDGATVRRRWPAIDADDDVVGLVQAESGLVSPERSVPLLQRLAAGSGAELRGGSVVRELRSADDHVELVVESTDRQGNRGTRVVRAGAVVVAADAWTNELLRGLEVDLPLTVLQEQVTYYDVAEPASFEMGRLPVWIWMDEPSFYGFPLFGRPGVKIAQDCGGTEVSAETRSFEPDGAILARTDEFARRFFGGRLGAASHTTTCLYTLTPDRDFVLDRVPGNPRVLVAQGAAHGFKFAAWFGRTLAALAAGAAVEDDLSPFAFDRPALRQPTGATRWLV
jgi:sarcosine oxidase